MRGIKRRIFKKGHRVVALTRIIERRGGEHDSVAEMKGTDADGVSPHVVAHWQTLVKNMEARPV